MSYTKTIVCLANSRKPPSGGRCIAGREFDGRRFGAWVRPVSARPTEEISEEERRYQNGQDPQLLETVAVPMSQPNPSAHQTENHVIDADYYWQRNGAITWAQLLGALDSPSGTLWTNNSSTYYGSNDRVPEADLPGITRSLYLIQPSAFVVAVVTEGQEFGNPRRRVRAQFTLNGHHYNMFVTDPVVERFYLAQADGQYSLEHVVLCVSLAGLHDGYAYKLAAAVITPNRAGG